MDLGNYKKKKENNPKKYYGERNANKQDRTMKISIRGGIKIQSSGSIRQTTIPTDS